MPFISRLKKLGTLPVPELETTLTVYLINLEHSQETNLVYTSSNPIPANAIPPANLRFECPEGRTKRGDVLIWASRVHKKACFVHACWVFDGHSWVKPSSDSEVMMDHPVHSDYQLVILSGPYVKWELKPDPDREPSLTVPDPPPLRPGARGSMNTILPSASVHTQQHISNSEGLCPRPPGSDTTSDTPDGSAAICSSSRFSTPLSEVPEDEKPDIRISEFPHDAPPAEEPLGDLEPSLSPPFPGATQIDSAHADSSEGVRPSNSLLSVSTSSTSPSRAVHERSKDARSTPPGHTPVTAALPTPNSSMRTRARSHVPSRTAAEKSSKSSPSLRRRKRQRPVDDDDFVPTSSRPPASVPHPGTLRPAKRRRLGSGLHCTSGMRIKLPPRADSKDERIGSQSIAESDDSESESSFWDELEALQREKDRLATQVKEAAELTAAHSKLVREARDRDDLIKELQGQLSEARAQLVVENIATGTRMVAFELCNSEAARKHERLQAELDVAALRIRELERESHHALLPPACTEGYGEKQLSQDSIERDHACRVADEARAELAEMRRQKDIALLEAKESKIVVGDIANERANDFTAAFQSAEDRKTLEVDQLSPKSDSGARPISARSEGNLFQSQSPSHPRMRQQVQIEDALGQLDEQKRRAASFEASLRVAQEALQRQRTHAQETEAVQHRTISQLARELQEKDQIVKGMVDKLEALECQIGELQSSILEKDNALNEEREGVRRAKAEMEQIKKATQADRLQIADLQTAVASGCKEMVAANDAAAALRNLVDQMQQEKKACDTTLAEEVRMRVVLEAQLLECQRSNTVLQEMHEKSQTLLQEHIENQHISDRLFESKYEAQRIFYLEHLALWDRERRRLEELLLESRSSLRLELACKARDLESTQAECANLKAERHADREKFNAELSACNERQAENSKRMDEEVRRCKAELVLATQSLEEVSFKFLTSNSELSKERDGLSQELCKVKSRMEQALSDSKNESAESHRRCQRVENEFSALQLRFHSQTRELESATAECLTLKAEATSDRQHFTSQLSTMKCRLAEQEEVSREQLAAVRMESRSAEDVLHAQCVNLEQKACRIEDLLKASQEEATQLQKHLHAEQERSQVELSSSQEKLSSLESLLETAHKERSSLATLLTDERRLKEQTVSESESKLKELEGVRAELMKVTVDLATAHELARDAISIQASLRQDLAASQSASVVTEEVATREQERLRVELRSLTNNLEESKSECSSLMVELASEREKLRTERLLSSDGLRSKLSSIEARLEQEKATSRSLKKQLTLAKEESSNYWSDLGSQLLRGLHDAQDELKKEQTARQDLEDILEEFKGQSFRTCESSHVA